MTLLNFHFPIAMSLEDVKSGTEVFFSVVSGVKSPFPPISFKRFLLEDDRVSMFSLGVSNDHYRIT